MRLNGTTQSEKAMSKELVEITSILRMRFVTNDTCHKAADRIEELERERDALQADNAEIGGYPE